MLLTVIISLAGQSPALLPPCVAALAQGAFGLGTPGSHTAELVVVAEASSGAARAAFSAAETEHGGVFGLALLPGGRNVVSDYALAASGAQGDWLLFLDAGATVSPGFWAELARGIERYPEAAGLECRLLPCEAGHLLNPATLETPYAAPGAFAVRREAYAATGGLDGRLPPRWAFIDLCRLLRGAGGKLYYLPGAGVRLADAAPPGEEQTPQSYVENARAELILGYKYGGVWRANRAYLRTLRRPKHFAGVRRQLVRGYLAHLGRLWPYLLWRFSHRAAFRAGAPLFWQDAALDRGCEPLERNETAPAPGGPLVSVIIRTHRRPEGLRRALQCLTHQTWPHWEAVVVEDGKPTTQGQGVAGEFARWPVRYRATGAHVGRSRAGNLGLEQANGEWLCFLDDDDLFYPEHLELLVAKALRHPEADLVLGTALAEFCENGEVTRRELMCFDRLDVFTMCQMCQIPIESGLFRKTLYERCGGLDERLGAHEDWAMWLRFLAAGYRANPRRADITRATSVFTQPANAEDAARRLRDYSQHDGALFGDESLRFEVTLADLRSFYDGMAADMRHLQKLGKLDAFLAAPRGEDPA